MTVVPPVFGEHCLDPADRFGHQKLQPQQVRRHRQAPCPLRKHMLAGQGRTAAEDTDPGHEDTLPSVTDSISALWPLVVVHL